MEVREGDLAPVFHLDLFKRRFDPPLDRPDMERARVKAVHFAYPERRGRQRVKLETLAGDGPFAILDLLEAHGGTAAFEPLTVVYAELEITLRVEGRSRRLLLRLWPDRCNLPQTPLGERLYACLKRWGICHGA